MKRILAVLSAALVLACSQPSTLKVISYNMRNAAKEDGPNDWALRKPATKAMLEAERPDILGVQEALEEQVGYIVENCPDYVHFGCGRNLDRTGEHASIFYNRNVLKMLEGGTWWLSETPEEPSRGWDAKYPRTATWALMEDLRNGRKFYFVNTHLDHKGKEARRNGLKMLVDKTRGMNPDIPLILMGDFNVKPDDPCLEVLEGRMLSAREVAGVTTDRPSSNGFGTQGKTIDYIYFAGFSGAEKFDVLDSPYLEIPYISDHFPIVAILKY